ncbi:MAG TPA: cytidylate kinase-like family protein [Bryobacteraceae bacterium]|nr:cytidylate kinase-like family protein [Bryobacteraceae bacterium]
MAVRVITVGREFGSGGGSIARLLADRLAWRLLDRELLVEVAKAAKVDPKICEQFDERCDPWFRGLVRSIWHGTGEWPSGVSDEDLLDARVMLDLGRKIIEEAARQGGCVVVGRGAQCILRGRPDVFHVFVYAPLELRKRRVVERDSERPDLEEYVRQNDRARAEYIQKYFGQHWCNPHLYDMMVNSRWGDEAAAAAVLAAAALPPTLR